MNNKYIDTAENPLVSIMIPTYNRPKMFEKTLKSALAQTYKNIEIIVNDNSTNDDTESLIHKYLSDKRLRYYRNKNAKTKVDNFRPFEKQARGSILQWCMDDDILAPRKLEIMVQVLRDNPEITLVTSQRGFIDEEDNLLSNEESKLSNNQRFSYYYGEDIGRHALVNIKNCFGEPSAILFRRIDLINHYWEAKCRDYLAISDVAMCLELLEKGNCVVFHEPLSYYRRHGEQEGQQLNVVLLSRLEWLKLLGEYHDKKIFIKNDEDYRAAVKVLYDEYLHKFRSLDILKSAPLYTEYMNAMQEFENNDYTKAGIEYAEKSDYDTAVYMFSRGIETGQKDIVELYSMLAYCANAKKDFGLAYSYMKKALLQWEADADKGCRSFQRVFFNNVGRYYMLMGDISGSTKGYKRSFEMSDSIQDKISAYGSYLFMLHCSNISWEDFRNELVGINDIFVDVRKKVSIQMLKNTKSCKHDKIRVGYMSPDFRQHVMFSFYYALLACYNHNDFYVVCYHLSEKNDGFTGHLKGLVDEWRDLSGCSYENMAEQIKADEIDILVDLAGHSANSGLPVFLYRPAKVQISGLGWMETTGLEETEYLITDRYIDTEGQSYITEQPLYLTSQFCYTARNDVPLSQGAPCLQKGYITFGVFNHWHKINDNILEAWQEIMKLVPNSRLLLKDQICISSLARQEIMSRLRQKGFDLQRIKLESASTDYMKRYLEVDIALDTFPYTGGGTTCDALYMGVPVVSLYGQRRGSRFGYSILENIGLGELAVDNIEDYIYRAVTLAQDSSLLDELHKGIRGIMVKSPLMDTKKYMQEMQECYRNLLKV